MEKEYPKKKITIFNEDVLNFNFHQFDQKVRIVGNLPYNISTPVLFKCIENIVIIKIGFNSQKMNAIRNCLYSSDEMKVYEERWITKVTNPIIKEKFGSSKYYQDDKTFDKSNPQLWIHATIAALKPDTPIEDIDKYIEQVQNQLVTLNVIGKRFSINEFKLRDPEMNITTIWRK
jgi:hypothetical protein